jgi:hypothetical protein
MSRNASEQNWKVSRVSGSIDKRGEAPDVWYDGLVTTPHGYVWVYSQGLASAGRWPAASTYRIIVGGRVYYRSEDVARTPRGLTTIAARFARRVARSSALSTGGQKR